MARFSCFFEQKANFKRFGFSLKIISSYDPFFSVNLILDLTPGRNVLVVIFCLHNTFSLKLLLSQFCFSIKYLTVYDKLK